MCFALRCLGTFGNYLSYLRAACHAHGYDAPPVGHPAIKRGMIAIVKRELFNERPKRFIQRRGPLIHVLVVNFCMCCPCRTMLSNIIRAVDRQLTGLGIGMLWLTSYAWLLRVPSEALPCCVGSPSSRSLEEQQTLIWREGVEICLRIRRRKNRPRGSGIMKRRCTCDGCAHTCKLL